MLFAPRPRATRVAFFDVGIPTRPPCLHIFFIISDTRVLSGRPAPARIGQQRAPRFEPRQHQRQEQGPRRDDRRPDRRGQRPDQRRQEGAPTEGAAPDQTAPEQQRPERRPDQRPDRRPKPDGSGQQQRQHYGQKSGNDRPRGPRPPREDRVALPPMPRPDSPFAVLAALKLKKD